MTCSRAVQLAVLNWLVVWMTFAAVCVVTGVVFGVLVVGNEGRS
jgi:hypothetical protein